MITTQVDMTGFNRGIAGLIHQVGLNSRLVVEKEVGELVKTLVIQAPPKKPNESRQAIKAKLNFRFQAFRDQNNFYDRENIKPSRTGLKYWAANAKHLYAGAADSDMTKASKAELLNVHYKHRNLSGSRRLVVDFKHPRKLQKVAITTKILTKQKQVNELIKTLQARIGRLKAAWMVGVLEGKIKITGARQAPQYVLNNLNSKTRGTCQVDLFAKDNPSITLSNFAKGVTGNASKRFVQYALNIRAMAMAKNASVFLAGKKPLSSYAR